MRLEQFVSNIFVYLNYLSYSTLMKTLILPIFILSFLFFSCEKTSLDQRAGTYIGEASVMCSLKVDSAGSSIETSIFDGSYIDTFTVELLDADSRKYRITRSSLDSGPCEKSENDIGFGGVSEYEFNEEFQWFYGYEYDKRWDSHIDLSDPRELAGYMFQKDIFGKPHYDNQGVMVKTTYYTFEYSIRAEKQ